MVPQNTGTPGRAPGPHATRPLIADTMMRVVACAVVVKANLKEIEERNLGEIVEAMLPHIQNPGRTAARNAVEGGESIIENKLFEISCVVEANIVRLGGKPMGDQRDYLEYLTTTAAESKNWRGVRKKAIIEIIKSGMVVGELLQKLEDGEIREELEDAWRRETKTASVDAVIASLRRRGVDGEALCWAVINRESLNHVLLVKREANRMVRLWPERKADDLIGYGWRGLRLALRSYKPETAWFSTYACPKIRGSIRDGVRNEHHLPKRLNTFVNKVERARDELSSKLGRHPTYAEIAAKLETELEKVQAVPLYATPHSLENGEEENGIQVIGAEDVERDAFRLLEAEKVARALSNIPQDEALAVRLLVMEQLSMQEVRGLTGASSKQLRARRDRGLAALRGAFEDDFEDGFED